MGVFFMDFCTNRGKYLPADTRFCQYCGAKREQPVSQPTAQLVFIKEGGQWKIDAGTSMKNTGG